MIAGGDVAPQLAAMYALLAERAVQEWQVVLTAVQELDHVGTGPVGYWGCRWAAGSASPSEPRVRAAVLGLLGSRGLAEEAAQITVPVLFMMQWDDELVPRPESLALFEALGSAAKTLHANSGKHGDLPRFETDCSLRFFQRHLSEAVPP
jgi:fermentation-respiration switch protein FrsA (DUF1100 family)